MSGHKISKDWKSRPRAEMVRHTFGPVARADARVLVLGSMPGVASLRAGEYYAHPQNQFWPIMGRLFGAGRDVPYVERLRRLQDAGVALWDVCAECSRAGSMDHAIASDSVKPNDFAALFRRCPRIHTVFFNGQTAARLFRKHVTGANALTDALQNKMCFVTLPSTSPAHASRALAEKLRDWEKAKASAKM